MEGLFDRQQYISHLIAKVTDSIEQKGAGKYLSSIILTGSLGRGEPTFWRKETGGFQLKSDVEIALVYSGWFQEKKVRKLTEQVKSEFLEELNLMPVGEQRIRKAYNFNYSFKTPKYKTLFTYDLLNGSKTVWGKDFLENKRIASEEIDMYEAKRLVANRIGELLYRNKTKKEGADRYFNMQWKGKLLLAVGSAWLICQGDYVSSYHGQRERLKDGYPKLHRLLGADFLEEYEKAFLFLREEGEPYDAEEGRLRAYIRRINGYFKEQGLCAPRVNSLSRKMKYMKKYLKTGMDFGILGFEEHILQALLDGYEKKAPSLADTAEIWYRVLY